MEADVEASDSLPVVTPFRPRGHPLVAWLIILAVVALIAWHQFDRRAAQEATADDGTPHRQFLLELRAQVLVGTAVFQPKSAAGTDLSKQVEALNVGSAQQRLCAAVMAGELLGPAAARRQLEALANDPVMEWTSEQQKLRALLLRIYDDYAAGRWNGPSVDEAERDMLRRELGWFGRLALAPAAGPDQAERAAVLAPAQRVALTSLGLGLGFVVVAVAGIVALFLVALFLERGRWRRHFQTGSPAGGVYAETFAVWLILFVALNLLARQLHAGDHGILLLGLAGPVSLLALGWPVLRGYSWRQVRDEIGLTAGAQPRYEPALGLVTYAMALPLVVVGLLVMLLLTRIQSAAGGPGAPLDPGDAPSHPIVDALLHADGWQRFQLFILACVIAPLTEETMFRGVLYRHLREATGRLATASSALLSATVVSFLFAIIHPQGFLGVPVLMALAYAFALAREWRGTLLPAMFAHGLNNGVAFTIFLLLMSP